MVRFGAVRERLPRCNPIAPHVRLAVKLGIINALGSIPFEGPPSSCLRLHTHRDQEGPPPMNDSQSLNSATAKINVLQISHTKGPRHPKTLPTQEHARGGGLFYFFSYALEPFFNGSRHHKMAIPTTPIGENNEPSLTR